MSIPQDPFILLGYINMKLRDSGNDLQEYCKSAGLDCDDIKNKLSQAGFEYNPEINQFR